MAVQAASCEIIAEAGVNHDGVEADALRLVHAAAAAQADAVKFQTFDPDELVVPDARTARYQQNAGQGERQHDMLARLVLPRGSWSRIAREAEAAGIEFLSTPFDLPSACFLVETLGMKRIKVGSGELTNLPFLVELARLDRPLLLSTGMATLEEVHDALDAVAFGRLAEPSAKPSLAAIREAGASPEARAVRETTVVMQCVTAYPAPHDEANLRVLDLYAALGVMPGYSDHTLGIDIALAAVARGARVLEKHLTLDRTRAGPDHQASLEPHEMRALVDGARRIVQALGTGVKTPSMAEAGNMGAARRGVVAIRPIQAGDRLGLHNLAARRAGGGPPPAALWTLDGQIASRDYQLGEFVEP